MLGDNVIQIASPHLQPGSRVEYRFWESAAFRTGTVACVGESDSGRVNVEIKRDGYRETAVIPADKATDIHYVRPVPTASQDVSALTKYDLQG